MLLFAQYKKMNRRYRQFCHINTVNDLSELLEYPAYKLILLSTRKPYHYFTVKKQNGKLRYIEAPATELMKVLRKLNSYLQSVYYFEKTAAAYGFVLGLKKDPAPRNIITNAERHLGCQHLLNIDMKDFFHLVHWNRVFLIFISSPFNFDDDLAYVLTDLCTNQLRLPMGAPTSPVLSNFATIGLDKAMMKWAVQNQITYTRFVDDLSFSSTRQISEAQFKEIEQIIDGRGYLINYEKVKFFGPKDQKEVTGLWLGDQVSIPTTFFDELRQDIDKLAGIWKVKHATSSMTEEPWLKKFQQAVQGKINFVRYVEGQRSPNYTQLVQAYFKATEPTEDELMSASWINFSYL